MAIEGTKGPGLTKEQLTAEMKHVSTPERLSTPFGELEFFDGVPKPESVQSIFDGLDLVRGITAFLTTVPGVSLAAMRPGLRTAGVDAPDRIGYTDPKCNSDSVYLTPNTETTYGITFLDLSALGADRHRGATAVALRRGRLLVPLCRRHGWVSRVPTRAPAASTCSCRRATTANGPAGTTPTRVRRFTNFVVIRALGGVPAIKQSRIYRLADADAPPENTFVNLADQVINTVHANAFSFFEEISELTSNQQAFRTVCTEMVRLNRHDRATAAAGQVREDEATQLLRHETKSRAALVSWSRRVS